MTVSAPKTTKKSKTTTKAAPSKKAAPAKKTAPAKKAAPAPTPAPTPAPVVENVVQEPVQTIESSMTTVLTSFADSIQALTLSLNKMKADFKVLEKQVLREAKTMDKVNAKRNKNKGSRAPSGSVKPAAISKGLLSSLV